MADLRWQSDLRLTLSLIGAAGPGAAARWPTPTSPGSTSASRPSRRSSSTTTGRTRHDRRDARARSPAPLPAGPSGIRGSAVDRRGGPAGAAGHRSSLAVLAGGLPAFVAVEYRDTFAGAIGVASLTALAENPAIRTLFGRPVALDDPGGFTVWRTGTVLAVLVGTWAVLTATRLTRGEEEAGRWDLLLSGRLRLRFLVASTLARRPARDGAVVGAAVRSACSLAGTDDDRRGAVRRPRSAARHGRRGASASSPRSCSPSGGPRPGWAWPCCWRACWCAWSPTASPALAWAAVADAVRADRPGARPTPPTAWFPLVVLVGWRSSSLVAVAVGLAGRRDVGAGLLGGRDRCTGPEPAARLAARPSPCTAPAGRCWAGGPAWRRTSCSSALLATTMIDFLRDNPVVRRAGLGRPGSPSWPASRATSPRCSRCWRCRSAPSPRAGWPRSPPTRAAAGSALLFSLPVARARWAATEAGAVAVGLRACSPRSPGWRPGSAPAGSGRRLGLGDALGGALSRRPGRAAVPGCGPGGPRLGAAGGARAGRPAGRRWLPAAGLRRLLPLAGLGAGAVAVRPPRRRAGRADGRRRRAGHARRSRCCSPSSGWSGTPARDLRG